jgi:hypothetical protein
MPYTPPAEQVPVTTTGNSEVTHLRAMVDEATATNKAMLKMFTKLARTSKQYLTNMRETRAQHANAAFHEVERQFPWIGG